MSSSVETGQSVLEVSTSNMSAIADQHENSVTSMDDSSASSSAESHSGHEHDHEDREHSPQAGSQGGNKTHAAGSSRKKAGGASAGGASAGGRQKYSVLVAKAVEALKEKVTYDFK